MLECVSIQIKNIFFVEFSAFMIKSESKEATKYFSFYFPNKEDFTEKITKETLRHYKFTFFPSFQTDFQLDFQAPDFLLTPK